MDLFKFFFRKPSSKNIAKERLQLVLHQERLILRIPDLERMKQDIINVISNYIEIDLDDLDIQISQDPNGAPTLIANIPVKEVRKVKEV